MRLQTFSTGVLSLTIGCSDTSLSKTSDDLVCGIGTYERDGVCVPLTTDSGSPSETNETNEDDADDVTDSGLEADADADTDADADADTDADEDTASDTDEAIPTAVCRVEPPVVSPISDSADWIGSGSSDPGGSELRYNWVLASAPAGSSATMPTGTSNRLGFVADLAGEYVGELTVINADGAESEPCRTTLTAEPTDSLWVEMFWAYPSDDMDLHLLAPGGEIGSDDDCYFLNCTTGLDWGVEGETSDDPILDLDDISGTGPENINIESPVDGVYTVVVHDYSSSVFDAPNAVTVNIYLNGILSWTGTRDIEGENTYTTFASIDTSTDTVTGE